MKCADQISELVECARRGAQPRRDLRAHLTGCPGCAERWEAECSLTDGFRMMRMHADSLTAVDTRRDALMQHFTMHTEGRRRQMAARSLFLALGAAAALFIAVSAGHMVGKRTPHVPARSLENVQTTFYQSASYETSADASSLSSDDFIAVPYVPPLAQGEIIRVVHADLYPEALASMGIDIDPAWATRVPVDVVMGEDGVPRAVRITDNNE